MDLHSEFEPDEGFDEEYDDEYWAAQRAMRKQPDPDALAEVLRTDRMITISVAQRYARIERLHSEALRDAVRQGNPLTDLLERSVRLELAAALSMTDAAAGRLILEADALVNRYPSMLDSLSAARTTPRHASLLVEALTGIAPDLAQRLLPAVVALAESLPVGTFRHRMRALIDEAQVVEVAERHEDALRQRRVFVERGNDGMGSMFIHAPAVELFAIQNRLTATAKALTGRDGETRTLDQIRADVLCDLLIDGVTDALPADVRGIRASVVVTVPALALLDPPDGAVEGAQRYGVVEGLGPIPIERARELCGGSESWMRVLTHPETGMVLSVGRDSYRPPPGLRRLVRWRAGTCMAPGCTIPASRCEIDHQTAWQHGGDTALTNLNPLCTGHHHVKHGGDWKVEQIPDSGGALQWTSPTGRSYRVEPERRIPVFTPVHANTAPF